MSFTLPPAEYGQSWLVVFDTAEQLSGGDEFPSDDEVVCSSRSTVVLTRQRNSTGTAGELEAAASVPTLDPARVAMATAAENEAADAAAEDEAAEGDRT